MLDGYYNFLSDLSRLFNYCIQKFEVKEDTVRSGRFEPSIFYKKYVAISAETLS